MSDAQRPEIGATIDAGGIKTNYLEAGEGRAVLLVHGSGPGVTGYANWRLTMPPLAERFRVIAPDMAGFGFTERPAGLRCDVDIWADQVVGVLDALGLERASIVGNSFGGAIALRTAVRYPDRVDKLALMGSAGVKAELTDGLDAVWGYEPSVANMRRIMDLFAYDRALITDELAEVRYRASTEPGFQESYSALFPAPRQRWVDAMVTPEAQIRNIPHETLIVHGREDKIIPLATSLRLAELIDRAQLHVFGHCGHWTQIERSTQFARILGDFLADAPTR